MNNGHVFPKVQNIVRVLLPTVFAKPMCRFECAEPMVFLWQLKFKESDIERLEEGRTSVWNESGILRVSRRAL